jgi:hypothetical protein
MVTTGTENSFRWRQTLREGSAVLRLFFCGSGSAQKLLCGERSTEVQGPQWLRVLRWLGGDHIYVQLPTYISYIRMSAVDRRCLQSKTVPILNGLDRCRPPPAQTGLVRSSRFGPDCSHRRTVPNTKHLLPTLPSIGGAATQPFS